MSSQSKLEPLPALRDAFERLKPSLPARSIALKSTLALVIAILSSIENVKSNVDVWYDLAACTGEIIIQPIEEACKATGVEDRGFQERLAEFELELTKLHLAVIELRKPNSARSSVQRFRKSDAKKMAELKERLHNSIPIFPNQNKVAEGSALAAPTEINTRLLVLRDKVDELVARLEAVTSDSFSLIVDGTPEKSQRSEIWKEALRAYEAETRCDPRDDSGCRDATDIVRRLVVGTEKEFETYRRKGEALRKAIKHILDLAQTASDALDDNESTTAPIVSVIATAVKFLVKAGRNHLDQYDVVIAILRKLHGFMTRFDVYRQRTISPSLHDILVKFFAQLLKTLGVITRWMEEGALRKSVDSLLSKSDVKMCLEELEKLSYEEHETVAANTFNIVSAVLEHQEAFEEKEQFKSIQQWLAAPMPYKTQDKHYKRHYRTTGSWFLEGPQYSRWKRTQNSVLWLHGKSGSGKSVLASNVINALERYSEGLPSSVLAYFYFDFNESNTLLCESLVASLVSQLLCKCVTAPSSLMDLHKSYSRRQRPPARDGLVPVLHDMVKCFEDVYIVLDGLDECKALEDDGRDTVLFFLKELLEARFPSLHLLVSSRPVPDIRETFHPHSPEVCNLDHTTVHNDIQQYLSGLLATDPYFKPLMSSIKVEIETTLLAKADGMFRWIDCQVQSLKSCYSVKEIREALEALPKGLDETYARYLRSVPEKHRSYVKRILAFLAFSTRAMTLEDLGEIKAVNIEPTDAPRFDPEHLPVNLESILTLCAGLIVSIPVKRTLYDPDSYIKPMGDLVHIGLAHFSVKEFLLSPWLQLQADIGQFTLSPESASHVLITQVCVNYLLQFDVRDPWGNPFEGETAEYEERHRRSHFFTKYAAQKWITHYRRGGSDESSVEGALLKLFRPHSHQFETWARFYEGRSDPHGPADPTTCWLYHASSMGLYNTVRNLLDSGHDVNEISWHDTTALQISSMRGHRKVVQLLLERGAPVNAPEGHYGTALQAASSRGRETVVRLLLDNGADIDAQGDFFGPALREASCRGHEGVVRLLLARGADPNGQHEGYGTALQAASFGGYEKVVRVLLASGADVNIEGAEHGTALQAATEGGHEVVVRMLLESGAKVDINGGGYRGTALAGAARDGHKTIVQILLEHGANPNIGEGLFRTALQKASGAGHEAVVRLLLERGAEINMKGDCNVTALQEASHKGGETVIRLLLENGADVNARGDHYGTALQAASSKGHEGAVSLLLENGADVNAQGGYYGTALQAASHGGHERVVSFLLQKGANVNAQGGFYGYALKAAALGRHEMVVRLLLENEAEDVAESLLDPCGWLYWSSLKPRQASHL